MCLDVEGMRRSEGGCMTFQALVSMAVVACFAVTTSSMALAQQAGKKEFELRGKVEKVDTKAKRLTVDHENVEGWMKAMKMIYKVDKEDVLKTLKPGDQITAKVYEGDFDMLYGVQRAPAKDEAAKPR